MSNIGIMICCVKIEIKTDKKLELPKRCSGGRYQELKKSIISALPDADVDSVMGPQCKQSRICIFIIYSSGADPLF
jgi:hypothetical protein